MESLNNNVEGNSNNELKEILAKRFQEMFRQNLSLLEVVFPHTKDDGSDAEKSFNALRSRILRSGNDAVRELDKIFENYVIFKLFEYKRVENPTVQTDIFNFKKNWNTNRGGK